jgi:transposase
VEHLKNWAAELGAARVVLAYEASGQGFGWHDEVKAAGLECHVLAPSRIPRSDHQRKRKNDDKDAGVILELLRSHYLAGNALPAVVVPTPQERDDREITRTREEVADGVGRAKTQIHCLLKREGIRKPTKDLGCWTRAYRAWLAALSEREGPLPAGARVALASLLRRLALWEEETKRLDHELIALAETPRHKAAVEALTRLPGVGLLVALVFLTEIGKPTRFRNRRQVASHLGLAPASYESGDSTDRKGHITRQGPPQVRRVLCQAVWSRVRSDLSENVVYQRLVAKNPKRKKIAIVACMRRLAIRMWHVALAASSPRAETAPLAQAG